MSSLQQSLANCTRDVWDQMHGKEQVFIQTMRQTEDGKVGFSLNTQQCTLSCDRRNSKYFVLMCILQEKFKDVSSLL